MRTRSCFVVALAIVLAAGPSAAQSSQISLDGSLPHGRTDVLTGPGTGPNYVIPEDLGWRSGANLFHSFLDLDIATGESATFTADAALPTLSNVIARVTGGEPSVINGRLSSAIPSADFYLLNPHGVLFGGGSSVDVPASFTVSTAHTLSFANGKKKLQLLKRQAPLLSSEPPTAFGFLVTGPRATVAFSNSQPGTGSRDYAAANGHTFSVIAGDVNVGPDAVVRAPSGRVDLAAVGSSAGEVPLDFAVPLDDLGNPDAFGEVRISGGARVLATTANRNAPQGSVVIRGGRFVLESDSTILAGDFSGPGGASIDIEVSGAAEIRGSGTQIRADAQASLPSGGVSVRADSITVSDAALVQTRSLATAAGGELVLAADEIRVASGAKINSVATRQGGGGQVVLDALRIEIDGGEVASFAGAPGQGGDIVVEAGSLRIANGSIAAESSLTGAPGDIDVHAQTVEVDGLSQISTLNQVAAGPAPTIPDGEIRIGSAARPAESVRIAQGGLIASETRGAQPGGAIRVFADALEVTGGGVNAAGAPRPSAVQASTTSTSASGVGGSVFLDVGTLRVGADAPGGLPGIVAAFVAKDAVGAGGSIELLADSALLEDGGQVSTTTQGAGQGGSIDAVLDFDFVARGARNAGGLKPSGLFARAEAGSSGSAGNISVEAATISVLDAAAISSRADDPAALGNSGDVKLLASDSIRVVGSLNASSVTARGQNGAAGNVTLAGREVNGVVGSVASVELLDGGIVDVSAGAQNGGLVYVKADTLRIAGKSGTGIPSGLGAEAISTGNAGGVRVEASGLVRVEPGGELNAIARNGSTGAAGDIEIAAQQIEFRGGRATANSVQANVGAGDIRLAANGSIRVLEGAELAVASDSVNDAGSLTLDAPRIEVRDSTLTAEAGGFGGNIEITTDRLELLRATIAASSEGAATSSIAAAVGASATTPAGGNITIHGGAVVVNQSQLDANGFGNANGGLIDITADPWLRSGDSIVTASSAFGLDGFVIVNTPYGEVTGDLAALPEVFLDASSLLETPCLARDAPSGSFAVQRLGPVLPPPDAPLSVETGAAQACGAP